MKITGEYKAECDTTSMVDRTPCCCFCMETVDGGDPLSSSPSTRAESLELSLCRLFLSGLEGILCQVQRAGKALENLWVLS